MSPRLLPLVLAPALLLAGCAATPAASPAASGGAIRVVASTDVWGDVVQQIGGDEVQVDSIITDPDRDPHEYQADPRDQLAVSRAQLVVVNGGGYDDFLDRLTTNAPSTTTVLDAVERSGLDPDSAGGFNEHIWYDLAAVSRVAAAVGQQLARIAPEHRAAFTANLARFQARVADLQDEERAIRASAKGRGVAITEPVPLYMTQALGLSNRTPAAFSEAVEEGDDVAPSVLRQQLALLSGGDVALLAYNEQTEGATTDQVLAAAKAAGVPAVGVRETLPEGRTWLQWMGDDLAAMRTALQR